MDDHKMTSMRFARQQSFDQKSLRQRHRRHLNLTFVFAKFVCTSES
jgi:hypothetical protein